MRREFRWFEFGSLFINGALAIIGIIALCIYGGQLEEMKKTTQATKIAADAAKQSAVEAKNANDFARDALVSLQRAFIIVNPLPEMQTTTDAAWFNFSLENTGTTPTRNQRGYINTLTGPGPIPENFRYPDAPGINGSKDDTLPMIGPKARSPLIGRVSREKYEQFARHEIRLYFYGWVRYDDIFEKTPHHLTRFCFEIQFVGAARLANGQEGQGFRSSVAGTHFNCHDQECEQAHQ